MNTTFLALPSPSLLQPIARALVVVLFLLYGVQAGAQTNLYQINDSVPNITNTNTWSLTPGGEPTPFQQNAILHFTSRVQVGASFTTAGLVFEQPDLMFTVINPFNITFNGGISGAGASSFRFSSSSPNAARQLKFVVQAPVDFSGIFQGTDVVAGSPFTIFVEGTNMFTYSSTNNNAGNRLLLINNGSGGGTIVTGPLQGFTNVAVTGNGFARMASARDIATNTFQYVTLDAGANATTRGGQLEVGTSFAAGTTGEVLETRELRWNGGSTISNSARIHLDLSATNAVSDRINLLGTLTKGTGSVWAFDFNGLTINSGVARTYDLITFSNTTFATADLDAFSAQNLNFGEGYSGSFKWDTGDAASATALQFEVVPEPSVYTLLGLAAAALCLRNRLRRRVCR